MKGTKGMRKNFDIGDTVTLTAEMQEVARDAAAKPEMYESGTVTRIGSWGIVDVLWKGIDHPISMRSDEIERSVKE